MSVPLFSSWGYSGSTHLLLAAAGCRFPGAAQDRNPSVFRFSFNPPFQFVPHSFPSLGLVLVSIYGHTKHPIPCWSGGRAAADMSQMETEARVLWGFFCFCFCFKDIQTKNLFSVPLHCSFPHPPNRRHYLRLLEMGQGSSSASFSALQSELLFFYLLSYLYTEGHLLMSPTFIKDKVWVFLVSPVSG